MYLLCRRNDRMEKEQTDGKMKEGREDGKEGWKEKQREGGRRERKKEKRKVE